MRRQEVQMLTQHFDEAIDGIRDPGKSEREARKLAENPLFAAGQRSLERAKWDMMNAQAQEQVQQQLGALGMQ